MLHGIDEPHLWHGNTLSRQTVYGGLYEGAPDRFDVVLTNPPFGGKEGVEAQNPFPFKTRATQVLFVQYVMQILEPGGRCGIVLDEGLLYRTNEDGFLRTKRKLLDECDLWCIVSLPGGAFTGSGAGVKTNLVFFTRGRKTERCTPEAETEHSWTVDFVERKKKAAEEAAPFRKEANDQAEQARTLRDEAKALRKADKIKKADALTEQALAADKAGREALGKAQAIEDAVYDLKEVNPREKKIVDSRTPAELLAAIEEKGREVDEAFSKLRALL